MIIRMKRKVGFKFWDERWFFSIFAYCIIFLHALFSISVWTWESDKSFWIIMFHWRAHFVRSQQIFPLFVSQLSLFSRSKSDEKQDEKTEERVNLGRKRSRKRTISKDRRQSLHYEDTMATYLLIQLCKVGTVSPKPFEISCLYSSLFSCLDSWLGSCLDSCLGSCSVSCWFRPTSCLFSCFLICFVSCFVSCLVSWPTSCLFRWFVSCFVRCFVICLVSCLILFIVSACSIYWISRIANLTCLL